MKEEEQEWEEVFEVEVVGDHRPVGFGKNGRSLFLEGNYSVEKGAYQLIEYDLIHRYLKTLPFFAGVTNSMQLVSSSYDDPHANVFTGFLRAATKQLPQVSTGSSEQGQGLNVNLAGCPGTELQGNPDIISRSNTWWNYKLYSPSQGLSGCEVGSEVYGKLVRRGGDYQVNPLYPEEQHHILPRNKGKKRKSDDAGASS